MDPTLFEQPPFWVKALPYVLLALAVFVVYGHTLDDPFLLDDNFNIGENPGVYRLWPLTKALNPPPGIVTFFTRPVVNFTMCVDYALGGYNPHAFRRTNLLLHWAAATALFILMRRTLRSIGHNPTVSKWLGLAAALIWLLHPLNTTAVNYLSQRGELGVALFLFLMLYALNRAIVTGSEAAAPPGNVTRGEDPRPRRPLFGQRGRCPSLNTGQDSGGPAAPRAAFWLFASAFFCLLGMGSKESMAAAPFLALCYDRIFLCDSWKMIFRRRRFFYLALAATWIWPVSRHILYSPHIPKTGFGADIYWRYPLTQAWGLTRMLRLSVWPAPLIFDYGNELVGTASAVWPQILIIVALLGATAWVLIRHPKIGFGWLVFWAILAPSSSVFPVTGQPIAEHRMYAPLAALVTLAVAGAWQSISRRKPGRRGQRLFAGLLIAVCGVLGIASYRRNHVYATRLTIWEDTVAKLPGSERAWNGLGQALHDKGRMEEALAAYRKALSLKPTPLAYVNAGITLNTMGRHEEAIRLYQEALQLDPGCASAENRMGVALAALNRYEESVAAQQRALQLKPDMALAHLYLADSLVALGRAEEALPHYREAIRLQPELLEPRGGLAVALLRLGRGEEAREVLQQGVRATRKPAQAYFEFSGRLLASGFMDEGFEMARRHLELDPWNPVTMNNVAWIMATSTNAAHRNGEEAARLAQLAVQRSGKAGPSVLATLAAAQAEAGLYRQAVATAERALTAAREQGQTNLVERYQLRLDTYRDGRPWRE